MMIKHSSSIRFDKFEVKNCESPIAKKRRKKKNK